MNNKIPEAAIAKKQNDNIHAGHRNRLTKRLMRTEIDQILDYELLEVLLYFSIPRLDTNPIAHALLDTFGSISNVLKANRKELMKIYGLGAKTVQYLQLWGKVMQITYNKAIKSDIIYKFGDMDSYQYMRNLFEDLDFEQAYMVYIDERNMIIDSELMFKGTFESVEVDFGSLAGNIFRKGSCIKCICVHNHPSGMATPSYADKMTTRAMMNLLNVLHRELYDSIIVTKNEQYSIVLNKKFKPKIFDYGADEYI